MPDGDERDPVVPAWFDPELLRALEGLRGPAFPRSAEQLIAVMRARQPTASGVTAGRAVTHHERMIAGDGLDVPVSVLSPAGRPASGLGVVFLHGGGMVSGNRFVDAEVAVDLVEAFDAVAVSVEYRLAPENPYPAAVGDAITALRWTASEGAELGIDPDRILLAGVSAGGGIAAAAALRIREAGIRNAGGTQPIGQLLSYPMLDDRDLTVSSRQLDGIGIWDRHSNDLAWSAMLGRGHASAKLPADAAPGRAVDLAGLPPTYVEVGSAEMFRDEAVAFASRVWACGGSAELHVWPGGFHAFDLLAPDAALSREPRATRIGWVGRLLARLGAADVGTVGLDVVVDVDVDVDAAEGTR